MVRSDYWNRRKLDGVNTKAMDDEQLIDAPAAQ